jgi:hypothetical protein
MKQLLYALSAICLVSCSPKLSTQMPNNRPPLPDNTFVLVLDQADRFPDRNAISTITFSNATYAEAVTRLKQTARSQGANLVKIISHKKPDNSITAKIYSVDNVKSYETKFEWSSDRKLTWEDYKGSPSPAQDTNIAATTSCRFGLLAGPSVEVTNEFICHQSSVRQGQQKPTLLAHEQLHFDLCEVYARKLRKELAANTSVDPREVFIGMYKLYKETQWLYDDETNHGLEPQAQKLWKNKIEKGLEEFAGYAR